MVRVIATGITDKGWENVMRIPVPRMRNMQILPGTMELWQLLTGKFRIDYTTLMLYVKPIVGVIICVVIFLLTFFFIRKRRQEFSIGFVYFSIILGLAILLTPSTLLSGIPAEQTACGNILNSNELVGRELSTFVQANDAIFWAGGDSVVPLLYLKDITIFPAQMNGKFAKRIGGNETDLIKIGFWNDALAEKWKMDADILFVSGENYSLTKGNWPFTEIGNTSRVFECIPGSEIYVYK
jgi:hypothetical protein